MFITQRYTPRIDNHLCELIGQIFLKSGEIRVRDSCARKELRVKHSFKNG